MVNVTKHGIILHKTAHSFESERVLNPATIKVGDFIHMFYRAVAENNYSTIGYCKLSSPMVIESRNEAPAIIPQTEYEYEGMEDPHIVKIEDTFYMTYTAYNGVNALGALATSDDLITWQKQGIVVPQITYEEFKYFIETKGPLHGKYIRFNDPELDYNKKRKDVFIWDKNLIFFPRKINDKFCFFHRIKPDIQIVVSVNKLEDLTINFWQEYFLHFDDYITLTPKHHHEESYIGSGCPPIETEEGWLMIYHGVHNTEQGYVYSACAALLELNNPHKEIARLPYPLFYPEKEWELKGAVNNVCLPTGAIIEKDILYIYYGAADERIALASMSVKELLSELLLNKA